MSPEMLTNKNVLITGGLGFIGSNLALKLLSQGNFVTIIDSLVPEYGGNLFNLQHANSKNLKINISDVRDSYALKHLIKNQDFLFNLAGQTSHLDSMIDPFTDLDINARSQLSIVEACRHFNPEVKLIFASTRQVYGKPKELPVAENHPIQPVDVNGINKLAGEWYHTLYSKVYGLRTSILRLTNTYGPRMRVKDSRQTFLGIWVKNIITKNPIKIYGDGKQIRDFNYIDDVVAALETLALSDDGIGEVFNLGSDEPMNLLEAANIICSVDNSASYELVPFPKDIKAIDIGDYYGDFRKIRSRLNWKPLFSFQDGIEKTIAYYREYLNNYL